MKLALVLVVLVAAIASVSIIAIRSRRQQTHPPGGFRDWVKNPEYRRAVAERFAEIDALRVPADISDAEIQTMVDRLFLEADENLNFERLKLLGARAEAALVRALENPKTRESRFPVEVGVSSPFERISTLLGEIGSVESAERLGRYLDHHDSHFRKLAALAIGSIGAIECISPILKALDDQDDYVRSYAMIGIHRGIEAGRSRQEFLRAVFPALTKLLDRSDSTVSGDAPRLLLKIDPDHAVPTLLSPKYFSVENRQVQYIIRAMNEAGQKIPHEVLLPFIEAVRPRADKYPYDYAYGKALAAYGRNPDASTESLLSDEMRSSRDIVRESAADALAMLAGIGNVRDTVFHTLEAGGFSALNEQQKNYVAVCIYDAEVNNGGHAQYFVNSSGDSWRHAMQGLADIGAAERATILGKATDLFGPEGPSEENETRHAQLAAFDSKQDAVLDDLDKRCYACKENLAVLLAQYAIRHRQSFSTNDEAHQ